MPEGMTMLGRGLFQFRSTGRNRENDERRIAFVRKALRTAVADAESEAAGLQARLEKLRTSVTILVARIEDGDPNPARRAELTNLEGRLRVGELRLARLRGHLTQLQRLEDQAAQLTP
jgi:hypothetical protein